MDIVIIDADGLFGVYFDGRKVVNNSYLEVSDILEKIIEYSQEFNVLPIIDSYVQFYLEFDKQFDIIDKAEGVFPNFLHEAIKLFGLE